MQTSHVCTLDLVGAAAAAVFATLRTHVSPNTQRPQNYTHQKTENGLHFLQQSEKKRIEIYFRRINSSQFIST